MNVKDEEYSENVEMYLKVIHLLEVKTGEPAQTNEIAEVLEIAPPSVTEMLYQLHSDGLVTHERYKGAAMTPQGKKIAKKILLKHHLIEKFITDTLGVRDKNLAHEQACKMEHVLDDNLVMRLKKVVKIKDYKLSDDDVEMELCSRFLHPKKIKRKPRKKRSRKKKRKRSQRR